MQNILCVICVKPNTIWLEFLSKFTHYEIFVIVDDNSMNYKDMYSQYTNIKIIQINNDTCMNANYSRSTHITIHKDITGWDKMIYYFSNVYTDYSKLWILEDDVFIYNENTLLNIDAKYTDSDLLSRFYYENPLGENNDWHWNKITIQTPPPYYCAMVCCIRVSKDLMLKIKDYISEYKTTFFVEALFSTICKTSQLKYDKPEEFDNVVWRQDFKTEEINRVNIYHPIKDIYRHAELRNIL